MTRSTTLSFVVVAVFCGCDGQDSLLDGDATSRSQAALVARTTSLAPEADSYVRDGTTNTNFGYKNEFWLRRPNRHRGLLRFSAAAIRDAVGTGTLTSATLELTIATPTGN